MIDPIGPNAIIQDPDRLRKLTLLDIPFNDIGFMDYARRRLGWVPETQEHLDRLDKSWPWKAKMTNVLTLYKEVLMCKDFIEIKVPNDEKLLKAVADYFNRLAYGCTHVATDVSQGEPVLLQGHTPTPESAAMKFFKEEMADTVPPTPETVIPAIDPVASEIPPIDPAEDKLIGGPVTVGSVDASGMPWDGRIHSSGKTTLKSGARKECWKYKKGITDAYIAEVEAELMDKVPTISEMVVNEAKAVADLPIPTPAAEPAPTSFVQLCQYRRNNIEWITPDVELAALSTFGLEDIKQVPEAARTNPALITDLHTVYEAMRG